MSARHDTMDSDVFGPEELALLAGLLTAELVPVALAPTARLQLLGAMPPRLHRFAAQLAAMVDVSHEHARELLDRALAGLGWEQGPLPGLTALWVEGGQASLGCIRGFLRLEAGTCFPHHRHVGDEQVLVLDGLMIDSSGQVLRGGDLVPMLAGSAHSYRALAGATDLLLFVVVRDGVDIGDLALRHRDAAR